MTEASGVDGYIAALPEAQRAMLQRLRTTIRAAAPEATERISYQMPAFTAHGRILVYYGAFRDHYSLFPASMAVLDAFRAEVAPYYNGKGTLLFAWDEPMPAELIGRIVAARLAENAARGRR
jgi:uncharacterized protein YdhG (YjbR/CyaY superfamily)